ncbi:AIPR family protein [Neisseria animalis]|uniref:Abortive phage resistance protein n=1 Tax=Neisseria animalis TaxID=492 RepID=A0A5P3MSR8_NEIAN|nr:AIPR family protein [Neisseria animalis]QEY24652.1 abortive phage resistance protein [Neisseria animalis]ROW32936.1 abortive phage resistance protein [Neisseria animalis]VEE07561.1 abortive infection phage resistance protein [Neisseria animalis]
MDFTASIIEQQILGLDDETKQMLRDELNLGTDENKLKSIYFLYYSVRALLDLDREEIIECIVDGGQDFGVDAIYVSSPEESELPITIIQAKYTQNLAGNSNFPENGIKDMLNALRYLFDPYIELGAVNNRLRTKIEQIRSMIRDGNIPKIRAIALNNGLKWNDAAQEQINLSSFNQQVTWEHVNHDTLFNLLKNTEKVDADLPLIGKAIVEDMNFSRVCIGRMSVNKVASLIEQYGDRLLERNVRRYLGLQGNRVNNDIHTTLEKDPDNFYFLNNGLTLVCKNFNYNALQQDNFTIKVKDLQIVNGGQTSMTLHRYLQTHGVLSDNASVLVRIYALPDEQYENYVNKITHATNNQNPVDLKDLRANDEKQLQLEEGIQGLGYAYHRKRSTTNVRAGDITSGTAAEAILSVIVQLPHQAKFRTSEHFGKFYEKIFFKELNAAQTIIAVQIYRFTEARRKKLLDADKLFVRYASCFLSMQMAKKLVTQKELASFKDIDHRNFQQVKDMLDANIDAYFDQAVQDIDTALKDLYNPSYESQVSLQQLSATFRRADLIELLNR